MIAFVTARVSAFASKHPLELVFIAGLAQLAAGVAMWSVPAALVVSGGLLIWVAVWLTTPPSRPES